MYCQHIYAVCFFFYDSMRFWKINYDYCSFELLFLDAWRMNGFDNFCIYAGDLSHLWTELKIKKATQYKVKRYLYDGTMEHVSQCISNKLYANMMLIKIMEHFHPLNITNVFQLLRLLLLVVIVNSSRKFIIIIIKKKRNDDFYFILYSHLKSLVDFLPTFVSFSYHCHKFTF